MKKKFIPLLVAFFLLSGYAIAGHIAGGEIYYKYLGKGVAANSSKYRITLRLFRECNPISINGQGLADLPTDLYMGIYTNTNPSVQVGSLVNVNRKGNVQIINKTSYNNCLVNKPEVCYQIGYYEFDQELPDTPEGYVVGYQTCCRSYRIVNVEFFPFQSGSNTIRAEGATYSCVIPGTNTLSTETNSSPQCYVKDTSLVCAGDKFTLDFSAFDPDASTYGDSLSYELCAAYNRGQTTSGGSTNYLNPPYVDVTYNAPFSGSSPLGINASIDPTTGIISGIAPPVGSYVVNVCITEWRNGRAIGIHRKDFTLQVTTCALQAVDLAPKYHSCDSYSFEFSNNSTNSNVVKYLWNFYDSLSTPDSNFSTSHKPTHVYKDTGVYKFSLVVEAKGGCQDSASSLLYVYPGFKAKIAIKGSCIQTPYSFADSSLSPYGKLTKWRWNFGEPNVTTDTSTVQNPFYQYPTSGQKTINFWVENSNGCMDSTTQTLDARAVPVLLLNPKSVLICSRDTVQLSASEQGSTGNEQFKWTSVDSIINPNTANPFVYPRDTTFFYVTMTDSGCVAKDSVKVNAVQHITVNLGSDTSICQTDSIQLHPVTLGNGFIWTSSTIGDTSATGSHPWVKPLVNTTYTLEANLNNKCFAKDTIFVTVYPYPIADAGNNDSVCYGNGTPINASIVADKFTWYPTAGLVDGTSLNTTARPDTTTSYVLTVYYTKKNTCPKPSTDTVTITVIPTVEVDAGNDTTVVVNQPLVLMAKGNTDSSNTKYLWTAINSSTTYLDNNTLFNPTGVYGLDVDSITYVVKATMNIRQACTAQDTVKVVVFQTPPTLFVPSAFTPDGKINKIFRPIPVGVLNLDFFSVYNRFGQLLYTTSQIGQGWDGIYNGVAQPAGGYIYMVQGRDYKGKRLPLNKGTFVLIR